MHIVAPEDILITKMFSGVSTYMFEQLEQKKLRRTRFLFVPLQSKINTHLKTFRL